MSDYNWPSYYYYYNYHTDYDVPDLPCPENLTDTLDYFIPEEGVSYCNSSFDSVICWPPTEVGRYAKVPCPPEYEGVPLNTEATTTKFCFPNGTWAKANYTKCVLTDGPDIHNYIIRVIFWVGYTSSTVALILALCIFGYFRSLHCVRNYIHCHLMVTFTLRNILWIIMHYSLLTLTTKITEDPSRVFVTWMCQLLVACYNYLQSANFFWMLVEGLYLHTMIVWASSADKVKMWKYALLGWGGPFVFILAWGMVMVAIDQKNCWLPTSGFYDFIFVVPVLIILAVNIVFLASIEYVLILKLKSPNSFDTRQYKKAVKGTIILFPLLGVIYVIMITPPGNNPISQKVFTYFNSVLQSLQGLLVAVFYCFLNAEVRHTIASRISRWRDRRSVINNYSKHSRGSIALRGTECTSMLLKTNLDSLYKNKETGESEDKVERMNCSRRHTRCSRLSSLNSIPDTSGLSFECGANENNDKDVVPSSKSEQILSSNNIDCYFVKHPVPNDLLMNTVEEIAALNK